MLIEPFTPADAASRYYTLTYESATQRGCTSEFRCIALDAPHAVAVVGARLEAKHGAGVLGDQRLMAIVAEPLTETSWPLLQACETFGERVERRATWAARVGLRPDAWALLTRIGTVLQ